MITVEQYFGPKPHSEEQAAAAGELLSRVNALLAEYRLAVGKDNPINPKTGAMISGSGNGGFRLPDCPEGAAKSSHKEAKACDIYDPLGEIDAWVTRAVLIKYNLYREHPNSTPTWCHLTTRAPASGCRTFLP